MAAIFQTTSSNAFSWTKAYEFRSRFHWSLFLRVQLTIFQHWFRWWLGADQATSHCLNQWWLIYRRLYASLGLIELSFAQSTTISLRYDDDMPCMEKLPTFGPLCRESTGDVRNPIMPFFDVSLFAWTSYWTNSLYFGDSRYFLNQLISP